MTFLYPPLLLLASVLLQATADNVVSLCSNSTLSPHHVTLTEACPEECPFSQPLEGGSCEKVCVKGDICSKFHPVRSYADPWSFQCAPPCGRNATITGCVSCTDKGFCKRCARGLLGTTWLRLSDDGTECVNLATSFFQFIYYIVFTAFLIFISYLVHLGCRNVVNRESLIAALDYREKLKLMPYTKENWILFDVHTQDVAGRGVALYFNSLCFVIAMALMLMMMSYRTYEFSDYARQLNQVVDCDWSEIPLPKQALPKSHQNESTVKKPSSLFELSHVHHHLFSSATVRGSERDLNWSANWSANSWSTLPTHSSLIETVRGRERRGGERRSLLHTSYRHPAPVSIPLIAVGFHAHAKDPRIAGDPEMSSMSVPRGSRGTTPLSLLLSNDDSSNTTIEGMSGRERGERKPPRRRREDEEGNQGMKIIVHKKRKHHHHQHHQQLPVGTGVVDGEHGDAPTSSSSSSSSSDRRFFPYRENEHHHAFHGIHSNKRVAERSGKKNDPNVSQDEEQEQYENEESGDENGKEDDEEENGSHQQQQQEQDNDESKKNEGNGSGQNQPLRPHKLHAFGHIHAKDKEKNDPPTTSSHEQQHKKGSEENVNKKGSEENEKSGSPHKAENENEESKKNKNGNGHSSTRTEKQEQKEKEQTQEEEKQEKNEEKKKKKILEEKEKKKNAVDRFLSSYKKMWDPILQAEQTKGLKGKYAQYYTRMCHACFILYFLIISASWLFQAWQLDRASKMFEDTGGADYCIQVKGLPKKLVDGRMVTAFFRRLAGDEKAVVGTSLAYDFYGNEAEVSAAIGDWLNELKTSKEEIHASRETPHTATTKTCQTVLRHDRIFYALAMTKEGAVNPSGSKFSSLFFSIRDSLMSPGLWLFDVLALSYIGIKEEKPDQFLGSGTAYVVFRTVDACEEMKRVFRNATRADGNNNGSIVFMFDDVAYPLHACKWCPDPSEIYWHHHTSWSHFWHKIIAGQFLMLGVVIVWMLMYVPYALYYVNFMNIPGISPSTFQDMLLGFLIALANVLLSVVIEKVTSWAGFSSKADRDVAVLSLAFSGSFLNTMFDLVMVAHIAKGAALDSAFLGESTGYDTAMANELYNLMVPGYMILPYFAVPIFEQLLPYWLSVWLIRSRLTIYLREGSDALQCPNFDICWRYADCLNNTAISLILLFFISPNTWRVMMWLLFFVLIIYFIDRYLLLRCTTATYYASNRLDCAFRYWWCFPTAILAFAVAFWGHRAYGYPLVPTGLCCVCGHVCIYGSMQILMNRFQSDPQMNRLDFPAAHQKRRTVNNKKCDYFNTNPIFCLRTRYLGPETSGWSTIRDDLGSENDECVPFSPGKAWLLEE